MFRDHLNVSVFCILVLAFSAQVQGASDEETPERLSSPEAIADAAGLNRARRTPVNRAKHIKMLKQFEGDIARTLELDEDEATQLGEVFQEYVEELMADIDSRREDRREKAEAIRELVDEMRDAQKERDTERVQEIREEISELRDVRGDQDEALDHEGLYEQIRELLTEEQVERFDPLADRFTKQLAGTKARPKSNLKLYRKAANSLDLSEDQRANVRRIFVEGAKEARTAKGRGGSGADADEAILNAILEELDEDQAKEFVRKVADLEKMRNRGKADRRSRRISADRKAAQKEKIREVAGDADDGREDDSENEEADGSDDAEEPTEAAEDDAETDEED